MGCKTESINALKRKNEEEDKGKRDKIFIKKGYINRVNNNKGSVLDSQIHLRNTV